MIGFPMPTFSLGPEGVGKKQIAFAFAKALNCRSFKSDSCNSCLKL